MKRPIHWLISTLLLSTALSAAFYGIAVPPLSKNAIFLLCLLAAVVSAYFVAFRWQLTLWRVFTFTVFVSLLSFPTMLFVTMLDFEFVTEPPFTVAGFHALWGAYDICLVSFVSYLEYRARNRERRTTVAKSPP